jgi:hypothetical protein
MRFEKKLFMQRNVIKFLPMNYVTNFYGKLNLQFISIINSPVLVAFTAMEKRDPTSRFNFLETF